MARTKITEDQEVSDTIVDANVASNAAIQLSKLGTGNLTLINQGSVIFKELTANGTDTVTIEAPDDVTTSYTLKLPTAQSSGSQVLTNDGSGNLSWATSPTTPVSVSNGGTGDTTLTLHGVLYGNGTSAVGITAAGTQYQVFQAGASGVPTIDAVHLDQSASVTGVLPNANTTATSSNTNSTIVSRDGSGNFSATTITASLTGHASADATVALDNLSSVAINTALLPGTDNSIALGSSSKRWTTVFGKDIKAGTSGTAGTVDIFPSTSTTGKIEITATSSSGDTTTTITNASQGGARTYTIPDAGASANFVLSEGTATINGSKTFGSSISAPSETLSNTTNQLVLGVTNTTTISSTAPSASRTYTIPDAGTTANFVLDQGAYTVGGTWTLSNALTITATTNQLVLSGPTRTATITAPQPATASRTYTFPDLSGNYNVVGDSGTQTIGGSKTFSSAVAITPTTNQLILGTTRTITISATQPATASRTYTIPDQGSDANFLMSQAAQTITGQQTLSAALLGADGTVSLPGYSFSADTDAGLYRIGADDIALATNGVKQLEISTTAVTTFLPTAIKGTTTNDNAAAGQVGEYVESTGVNVSAATSGNWGDLTSISLTSGDWNIMGSLTVQANGATITSVSIGVSSSSGNVDPGTTGQDKMSIFIPTTSTDASGNITQYRFSLSGTTTIYLKMRSTYTVATPNFNGFKINARRVR